MKTILFLLLLPICFYGCKNTAKQGHVHETTEAHDPHAHDGHGHDHAAHDHATHDHKDHDHAHEGHDHAAEISGHAHEGEAGAHSDEIIFTKAQAARTEFEVREIQPATFHQVIKTTGQILSAPGDESVIVATNNGVVSYADHDLTVGSPVQEGEPVFYIASKHLGDGDYYERTRAAYEQAKAEYERAQKLIGDKIISQKEFESIVLAYQEAKIAFDAISGKNSPQGVGVNTPLGGYIKSINVKDGEYVTAGQAIATVSQNRRLVLRADVSEKHYAALRNITTANFKTPYDNQVHELKALSGRLLSAGKSATDNTFFIPVTFEFDNRGDIIPGSFVEVYLISTPMENVISLPLTALTNEMGYFYVYRQLDEEGYQKQEVQVGASNGKEIQILNGVHPGDRIVTKGAYQVKMASASAAIPGHTHEH